MAGSRAFTVREIWTSANPVPISGGGTGGNTQATARVGLGLGDAETKNAGESTEICQMRMISSYMKVLL